MALNLTVDIDKDSGFCFGVVYAIDMAEEILEEEDIFIAWEILFIMMRKLLD
jgi:4-hydroxy-3-methylbut-2-enyl diphosphate reductase IspH